MSTGAPPGLFASLRRLLGTALGLAEVRLELFATELQFEKLRLLESLAWMAAAVMAFGVGLVLLSIFVVLLVGEPYRTAAVGVLTLLYLGLAWAALAHSRRLRVEGGKPFEASLAELKRDRAALGASDPQAPV